MKSVDRIEAVAEESRKLELASLTLGAKRRSFIKNKQKRRSKVAVAEIIESLR